MKAVNLVTPEHEHEFEAAHGLPETLPAGEYILWQGSPDARSLAAQALHVDKLAVYFGLLMAWRALSGWYDGQGVAQIGAGLAVLGSLGLLALGLLGGIAWLMARTSVYTLTNRRVVMRIGVVLSITFNLPFAQITAAHLRLRGRGVGDITLQLNGDDRIAYLHLWPHVRPWRLRQTEPMLRALPDAENIAQRLAAALQQVDRQRISQRDQKPGTVVRPVRLPSGMAHGDPAQGMAPTVHAT